MNRNPYLVALCVLAIAGLVLGALILLVAGTRLSEPETMFEAATWFPIGGWALSAGAFFFTLWLFAGALTFKPTED